MLNDMKKEEMIKGYEYINRYPVKNILKALFSSLFYAINSDTAENIRSARNESNV